MPWRQRPFWAAFTGSFIVEPPRPTDGPIWAWSRSALTGLLCSLSEAEVNNEREIESVTLRVASAARSSLSSSTVIYSPSRESVWTQPVAAAISAWAGGFSHFGCSRFVPEVSANGPRSCKSVDATDGTVPPKNVPVYSGMPPGF